MTRLWSLKTPPPGKMTEDGTLPWYGVYTSLMELELSRMIPTQDGPLVFALERDAISLSPAPLSAHILLLPNKNEVLGHYNAILVHRPSKQLVWFEPLGSDSVRPEVDAMLRTLAEREHLALIDPKSFEPKSLQRDEPVCGAACLMFLEATLRKLRRRSLRKNAASISRQIVSQMNEKKILRFAAAKTEKAVKATGFQVDEPGYWKGLKKLRRTKKRRI